MVIVQQEDGGGDERTFTFVHSSGVFPELHRECRARCGYQPRGGRSFPHRLCLRAHRRGRRRRRRHWRWYLNGAPAASGSVASPAGVESNAGTFVVGVHKNLTGSLWDGVIDEVALYTEALSPERIAAHYEAIAGPPLIESFSADDLNLPQGGATTLRWQVDPAVAALTLDPGGIDALALSDAGQGSYGVAPAASQTYTLTAQDAEGGAQAATVSVFVAEPVAFRLNEIMAQSGGIYEDEDGDDSDWIEIRNASNASRSRRLLPDRRPGRPGEMAGAARHHPTRRFSRPLRLRQRPGGAANSTPISRSMRAAITSRLSSRTVSGAR
ncbi:MAG: LamG-like jellyroll fold domain-containing protein [Verrucomicrobiales bacterium]